MHSIRNNQRGGSAIGTIVLIAVLGASVYVGLQYVPQYIESSSVNSMLDSLQTNLRKEPPESVADIWSAIDKQLYINERENLKDSFKVSQYRGDYTITVSYDRELNLLYDTKTMHYEKSITVK